MMYKPCYKSCKTCNISGNETHHNCNECVTDCSLTNNKYNYISKCFTTCPNGTYNNNFICESCHPDCKICDKSLK